MNSAHSSIPSVFLLTVTLLAGCTEPAVPPPSPFPNQAPKDAAPTAPPTVKIAEHPVQANLAPGDPRAWQSGAIYQPPPVAPLTEHELRLQSQVQSAGGRFLKRAITADERQANSRLGVQFTGDAAVAVNFDRLKSAGKLATLDNLDGVTELGLSRSDVNDNDLQQLSKAKDLIALDLNFTQVTDAGLAYIERLPNLRFLVVENTGVSTAGVQRLKTASPRLRIFHSSTHADKDE